MSQPLVSVIITTYNRAHLVCRAIDSVLAQTYKNIEIIVVDDCSSDGTEATLEKYKNDINYKKNEKNLGLSASRNIGILSSSGEYVSFLDDDDEILPEKIEKQIFLFLKYQNIDVLYCGVIKKYLSTYSVSLPKLKGNIYPEVLRNCPGPVNSLIIKRKCIDQVGGFDDELKRLEDFDFWIRLSKCCLFDFLNEALVVYNIHGDQMLTDHAMTLEGRSVFLKKYENELLEHKEIFCSHLRRQAFRHAYLGDYFLFYSTLKKSITLIPYDIRSYVHIFFSFLPKPLHKKIIEVFFLGQTEGLVRF